MRKKRNRKKTWLGSATKGALAGAIAAPMIAIPAAALASDKNGTILKTLKKKNLGSIVSGAPRALSFGTKVLGKRSLIGASALGAVLGGSVGGMYGLDKYGLYGNAQKERAIKKRYQRNKKLLKRVGISI